MQSARSGVVAGKISEQAHPGATAWCRALDLSKGLPRNCAEDFSAVERPRNSVVRGTHRYGEKPGMVDRTDARDFPETSQCHFGSRGRVHGGKIWQAHRAQDCRAGFV